MIPHMCVCVYFYIYSHGSKRVDTQLKTTVFLKGRVFSPLADVHPPQRRYRFFNPNAPQSFPPSLE